MSANDPEVYRVGNFADDFYHELSQLAQQELLRALLRNDKQLLPQEWKQQIDAWLDQNQ